MVSKILDASAFYAGIPFLSTDNFLTTTLVFDEIQHIKKNHDAIGILIETKRLKVMEPNSSNVELVKTQAKKNGDFTNLSKPDISAIALCVEMNGEIFTDDFSVSNVSKNLKLKVVPLMTSGIKDVGSWVHYCPGCRKNFEDKKECPLCGNLLKRKLLKEKPSSV